MAVIGATGIEPVNFLEQYAKGLQVGAGRRQLERQEIDRIKAAEQQRAMNELYAQSVRPGGGLDANALVRGMAQQGMGSAIPDFMAGQAEIAQKTAAAAKSSEEADKMFWETSRNQLALIPDNDQTAYQAWATNMVRRAPWTADLLPETIDKASKDRLLMTADMVLPKGEKVDLSGGTAFFNPYTREQIGTTIMNVPKSPEVLAQEIEKARAGAPTTVIGGTGEFGKAIAGGGGEEIVRSREQASSALASINNTQSLLPLVSSPEFISGTLGDARLAVAKALNLPGATETQAYFSGIGRDVAEIIKAFGAGTGLSDADREFAKGIAGGNINLTGPAIRKILWLNANYNNERIKRYNQRVAEIAANPLTDQTTRQQLAVLHAPIPMGDIGPRPVMSKDEAKLLPPGTQFIMPDGGVYRVPQKKK